MATARILGISAWASICRWRAGSATIADAIKGPAYSFLGGLAFSRLAVRRRHGYKTACQRLLTTGMSECGSAW